MHQQCIWDLLVLKRSSTICSLNAVQIAAHVLSLVILVIATKGDINNVITTSQNSVSPQLYYFFLNHWLFLCIIFSTIWQEIWTKITRWFGFFRFYLFLYCSHWFRRFKGQLTFSNFHIGFPFQHEAFRLLSVGITQPHFSFHLVKKKLLTFS